MIILDILIFILILGLVVMIHEFGHLIFAKMCGCLVREYAIGMGPKIGSRKKGEIEYSLRAFPIGGFCSIAGETEEDILKGVDEVKLLVNNHGIVEKIIVNPSLEEYQNLKKVSVLNYNLFGKEKNLRGVYSLLSIQKNISPFAENNLLGFDSNLGSLFIEVSDGEKIKKYIVSPVAEVVYGKKQAVQIAPRGRNLGDKKKRSQLLVMFGGPFFNFLLGFLVFFIAGILIGKPVFNSNKIGAVLENSTASILNLQKDDHLISLNDEEVSSFFDIDSALKRFENSNKLKLKIKYKNKTGTFEKEVYPQITSLILGGVIFTQTEDGKVIVYYINSKLKQAGEGLKEGVVIKKINENEVNSWRDLYGGLLNLVEKEKHENKLNFVISFKDETEKTVAISFFTKKLIQTLTETPDVKNAHVVLGVMPSHKYQFGSGFISGFEETFLAMGQVFKTLRLLFVSKEVGVRDLSGPIGIFSLTQDVRKKGFIPILRWIGLLSVNIGLLNLLPIPALDGGRMLFVLYEAITKKKPNKKIETILITSTLLLLFGLIIFVSINDVMRIIRG